MRGPRPYSPESADPESVSPSGRLRALKQAWLVLLCAAWVFLGLLGHDPWKSDDALSFGSAWEMIQRSDWVVPHVAQLPALDRGPLSTLLSAAMLKAFSPPLEPYDAARLAAGLLLVLILALTAWTGRELNGRAFRWVPVLILIGTIGFFDRSHQMSPELGLAFAVALALYGVAVALRRPLPGGALLGAAVGVGFLAYGYLGPLWIGAFALALPLAGSPWRTRAYAVTLVIALAIGAAIGGLWPAALYLRSPAIFQRWTEVESLREYLALLPGADAWSPNTLVKNLIWFAWPALPLILWTLWVRGRGFNGGLAQPGVQVPGTMAIVILAGLLLMPSLRIAQAVPLLVPLALLASVEVDSLERDLSAALDWFGILTFGLAAIFLWGIWIDAYLHGMSPRIAAMLRDTHAGYATSFRLAAMIAATALTLLWIALVRPARRSNRRAILNWAAGLTLIWGLVSTIWLPYIDSRRTYRNVAESIAAQLPADSCTASRDLAEPQRALFYYFSGIVTVPESDRPGHDCRALLVQYGRLSQGVPELPGWTLRWDGARRGDEGERYAVYRKAPS